MRKGILSLSPLGRRRGVAKVKTTNMEKAEKTAVKPAEAPLEQTEATGEKAYVQTIMVPKPRNARETKPKGTLAKTRKTPREK